MGFFFRKCLCASLAAAAAGSLFLVFLFPNDDDDDGQKSDDPMNIEADVTAAVVYHRLLHFLPKEALARSICVLERRTRSMYPTN